MKGYPKVKGFLVEHGIKQKDVAVILDITVSTFNNKLNGVGDFTMTEVRKMCYELGIDANIFFADFVPNKQQREIAKNQKKIKN